MHLISSLLSGIRGAENGHAELHRRGALGTRVTWYDSFEGGSGNSSGANLTLDAYGRTASAVYVNELTRVIVKSSAGTTIVDFVEGESASSMEYRGQSFTGVDYDSAGAAVSNPIDLDAILDLWKTQNGAIDWKVLSGASALSIKTAIGPLVELVYNVKSSAYGAVGNATNNDTSAIQAAIDDAATAGGGIVFFPKGSYAITSTLTVGAGVSLLGVGGGHSTIQVMHATANGLTFAAQGGFTSVVDGIGIRSGQANTGSMVTMNGTNRNVHFVRCSIGGSLTSGILVRDGGAGASQVRFRDCEFTWATSSTANIVNCNQQTSRWTFDNCLFAAPATYTGYIINGTKVDMRAVRFDTSACASGTVRCYSASSTTLDGTMGGCIFSASGGATVTGIVLGVYVAASKFHENGSLAPGQEDANFTLYSYTANVAGADVFLGTRERRSYHVSNDDASLVIDASNWGAVFWTKTGGTAVSTIGWTLGSANNIPEGGMIRVHVWASNGAISAVGFSLVWIGATGGALGNGKKGSVIAVSGNMGGAHAVFVVGEVWDVA